MMSNDVDAPEHVACRAEYPDGRHIADIAFADRDQAVAWVIDLAETQTGKVVLRHAPDISSLSNDWPVIGAFGPNIPMGL